MVPTCVCTCVCVVEVSHCPSSTKNYKTFTVLYNRYFTKTGTLTFEGPVKRICVTSHGEQRIMSHLS